MHHHLKHFAYFVSILLNCRKQSADDESKTDTEMTWHKLRLELEMVHHQYRGMSRREMGFPGVTLDGPQVPHNSLYTTASCVTIARSRLIHSTIACGPNHPPAPDQSIR
ncbi:hypothetical protein HYFRA_00008731 [Hymenoscyphus fraxineus]|uniref:Uncharacterized protein n=1 Tax=Hymenoscyphus fraxineus TaxID=746836 RepID=A0A9N9PQK3_9HELO|nr:hypothetical protein HYFRA_00008731 [Hymenoscyphus fraxineus]